MANANLSGALGKFTALLASAKQLDTRLRTVTGQAVVSGDLASSLEGLAILATNGESLLASGATKLRDERIAALTNQIQGLEFARAIGVDAATANELESKVLGLKAQRAQLFLQAVGDFSGIVRPDQVRHLIALAVQVHDAALEKQRASDVVLLVEQVVTTATAVVAAVGVL